MCCIALSLFIIIYRLFVYSFVIESRIIIAIFNINCRITYIIFDVFFIVIYVLDLIHGIINPVVLILTTSSFIKGGYISLTFVKFI